MTLLRPPPVLRASLFSWDRSDGHIHGVAELSDLGGGCAPDGWGRVHDDSCDVGFTVVSDLTEREVVFRLVGLDRDDEGDLVAWRFRSISRDGLPPMTVVVFND